jgi:ubiquitin C
MKEEIIVKKKKRSNYYQSSRRRVRNIHVKCIFGENIAIDVYASDSIENLKQNIEEVTTWSPEYQSVIFGGKHLEEGRTLSCYNIGKGCMVHLMPSFRGC